MTEGRVQRLGPAAFPLSLRYQGNTSGLLGRTPYCTLRFARVS